MAVMLSLTLALPEVKVGRGEGGDRRRRWQRRFKACILVRAFTIDCCNVSAVVAWTHFEGRVARGQWQSARCVCVRRNALSERFSLDSSSAV